MVLLPQAAESVRSSVLPVPTQTAICPTIGQVPLHILHTHTNLDYVHFTDFFYRWLYHLLLTIDANFCLKNKDHLHVKNDAPLGDGWGHCVPEKLYLSYVKMFCSQVEVL